MLCKKCVTQWRPLLMIVVFYYKLISLVITLGFYYICTFKFYFNCKKDSFSQLRGQKLSYRLIILNPFLHFLLSRIPLKRIRRIRREMTDSGRRAEELLVDKHSLKYNFDFRSSTGPTPEILTNYLDVSITLQITDLWTLKSFLSLMNH